MQFSECLFTSPVDQRNLFFKNFLKFKNQISVSCGCLAEWQAQLPRLGNHWHAEPRPPGQPVTKHCRATGCACWPALPDLGFLEPVTFAGTLPISLANISQNFPNSEALSLQFFVPSLLSQVRIWSQSAGSSICSSSLLSPFTGFPLITSLNYQSPSEFLLLWASELVYLIQNGLYLKQ